MIVGRSTRPSASESGSPGGSPAKCPQSTKSKVELACQPQTGADFVGE
ncbi:MAG: hypothetical protein PVF83_09420 [Anaerolineales bacterium]